MELVGQTGGNRRQGTLLPVTACCPIPAARCLLPPIKFVLALPLDHHPQHHRARSPRREVQLGDRRRLAPKPGGRRELGFVPIHIEQVVDGHLEVEPLPPTAGVDLGEGMA